jgi:hypothetical protein
LRDGTRCVANVRGQQRGSTVLHAQPPWCGNTRQSSTLRRSRAAPHLWACTALFPGQPEPALVAQPVQRGAGGAVHAVEGHRDRVRPHPHPGRVAREVAGGNHQWLRAALGAWPARAKFPTNAATHTRTTACALWRRTRAALSMQAEPLHTVVYEPTNTTGSGPAKALREPRLRPMICGTHTHTHRGTMASPDSRYRCACVHTKLHSLQAPECCWAGTH